MVAVIQRVLRASVKVDGAIVGECGHGLAILLGVAHGDTVEDADKLMTKISKLRIFCDENGKMNLSVNDIGGSALVISQFTLLANYAKGNRPDYLAAAKPDQANELYEYFVSLLEKELSHVGKGRFGAHMEIDISADGPVTVVMDSSVLTSKTEQRTNN